MREQIRTVGRETGADVVARASRPRCEFNVLADQFDGLGAADCHGHAGDKDDEDQPEFVHGSGIGTDHPSRTGALDPFGGDG